MTFLISGNMGNLITGLDGSQMMDTVELSYDEAIKVYAALKGNDDESLRLECVKIMFQKLGLGDGNKNG